MARRRTQTERSTAMRRRLQQAALQCLVKEGYAGTTVSAIVKRARVSRGAQLHHYPNKNELIRDAAATLMRRLYRRLGEVLLSISEEDDRLPALIHSAWDDLYTAPEYAALLELLLASRRDKALAKTLRELATTLLRNLRVAAHHYFEPRPGAVMSVDELFVLLQWQMRGMASDARIITDTGIFKRYLGGCVRLLATQMRARRGVNAPPPKPAADLHTDANG